LSDTSTLLARLESGLLDGLVGLLVEFILERPVAELLEPEWIADQVITTLDATTRQEHTEAWIRDRIAELRQRVPEGSAAPHVPPEVAEPLRAVLAREHIPDRDLIGRLIDHAAMERIFKDILIGSLSGFAQKVSRISEVVPQSEHLSRGIGRLKALQRKASHGVLGGLSQELERTARGQIRDHVEKSIHATLSQVADHICAAEHAGLYGEYRVHLLDTLLATDAGILAAEVDKMDPDSLVSTAAAVTRAVVSRPGIREEIAAVVRLTLEGTGGRSVQDFLDESGLDQGWRAELEQQIAAQARVFIRTPGFEAWLGGLLEGAEPAE
jgi:hypothetical protein